MKKLFLSFGLIIVFAFYVLISSGKNAVSQPVLSSNTPTTTTIVPPKIVSETPSPAPTPVPVSMPVATTNTGKYKNGTYTGPVVDAYFGNIQVSAIVQNGALTDVQFLQYPTDRSTSVRINNQAIPVLKSEAIKAQSASVNGVSGATQTSDAFKRSLGTALATALN